METVAQLETRRLRVMNELWEGSVRPTPEKIDRLSQEWVRIERALARMGEPK